MGNVVVIFPNRAATQRPVGAAPAERHDEWAEGRRYFTFANHHHDPASPPGLTLEATA